MRSHGSSEANAGCDLETTPVRRRHESSEETAPVKVSHWREAEGASGVRQKGHQREAKGQVA